MANTWYSEKLKHPKWEAKRLEILQRDGYACQWCSQNHSLHVHHCYYKGDPWEVDNTGLMTLCNDCHYVNHLPMTEHQAIVLDRLRISYMGEGEKIKALNRLYKALFQKPA